MKCALSKLWKENEAHRFVEKKDLAKKLQADLKVYLAKMILNHGEFVSP